MTGTRDCGLWALRTVLGTEAEGLSEELLFGLGAGLWFHWDPGARFLSGRHPHRVVRAFMAMNVTAMAFRHLDPGALGHVAAHSAQGQPTIVTVPRRPGPCSSPRVRHSAPETTLVVTGFEGSPDAPQTAVVRFLHPEWGAQEASASDFVARWMGEGEGHRCAGWIAPLFLRLRFDLRFAVRRALWSFSEQMTARVPTLGHCGLPGLRAFVEAHADALVLDGLEADSGSLDRDTMAVFLRRAAGTLACDGLAEPASLLDESARVWKEALRAGVHGAGALASRALALETQAVADVRRIVQWKSAASDSRSIPAWSGGRPRGSASGAGAPAAAGSFS